MHIKIKPAHIETILGLLILMFAIKLLWFAIEAVWLPVEGIDRHTVQKSKPLYYKIKLASKKKITSVQPTPQKKPVDSIRDIKLLALYNASDITVVTIEYKRKTKVLGRGDTVNGFVLEGAGNDFATFSKGGKMYRVDLIKPKHNGKGSIASVTPVEDSRNDRAKPKFPEGEIIDAGDHKIIEKSLFEHYLNNIDDIYKNIGIQEIRQANKKKVFQVTFVRRGGPFDKLGVKRGDILKSINGEVLNGYSAAFEAYKNMKDVRNITLVIQRGNKTMELEYEID